MKIHTTNYFNSFILIALDSNAKKGEKPPEKLNVKTVANLQFEILQANPYSLTSDEIMFQVFSIRQDLMESEKAEAKKEFFSKSQACFRTSPLTKRYGWGLHYDENGKMAIYCATSIEYQSFLLDNSLKIMSALKSKR